jgi:cystathionine gamma-synthase
MSWEEGFIPCQGLADDSMVLNPHRKYYAQLKETMTSLYEDVFWPQDAVFMERNSRDFIARIHRVDTNAEAVCQVLISSRWGTSF